MVADIEDVEPSYSLQFTVSLDGSEDGVPVSDTPVPFTKKLSSKSTNKKLIKQLQTRLQELGYYENEISGNFQKYTTRAVKKFQLQNGLEQTGVVDETTWNLIFNDSHIVLPNATPKPTPEPTPVPFHIVVDVANQITSVYGRDENGEYTVPVRQMLCSTGMKATPSPLAANWRRISLLLVSRAIRGRTDVFSRSSSSASADW